jgi:hypothetical protein
MHSKNLSAYLDSTAGIATLLPQAERLIQLRHIYEKLVPKQLLESSSIVNYRQRRIVIFADNNAIAAKLKLLTPRLIDDFSKFGVEVTGIRLEVQPRQADAGVLPPKRALLSRAASAKLQALASRLPDSQLKQAVADLAGQCAAQEELSTPETDAESPNGRTAAT